MYKVYVQVDESENIVAINSDMFLQDTTGWIEIDSGEGDKYRHAQGNYFDKSIVSMSGVYQYKMVDGAPVEKTPAEIIADTPMPAKTEEAKKAKKKADYAALTKDSDRVAFLAKEAGFTNGAKK